MRVVAVVLAAGEGRRMGGCKALLRDEGHDTFLARVARLLARPGVAQVVAVLGHDSQRVRAEAGLLPGVTVLENPRYPEGMVSSVRLGIEEAQRVGAGALLLHPVDHPLVEPDTIDAVVDALRAGATVAVPTHGGRRGHPGGFGRAAWAALAEVDAGRGARAVLADHPDWVVHVAGGPGCVSGIDTPDDYARWFPGLSRRP